MLVAAEYLKGMPIAGSTSLCSAARTTPLEAHHSRGHGREGQADRLRIGDRHGGKGKRSEKGRGKRPQGRAGEGVYVTDSPEKFKRWGEVPGDGIKIVRKV